MSIEPATHPLPASRNRHAGTVRWCASPVRLLLICVIGLSLSLAAPATSRAGTADDDYDASFAHFQKSRWKLAAEAFRGFLKRHKSDRRVPFARLYLGSSLENLENYREARDELRGFVKDYPKNLSRPDAMFRVAECSYFLSDLKTAEQEFQAFLKEKPDHEFAEFAHPYLGDVQYRLNKPKEAAVSFELALEKYKDGRMADDAKFGLARCHVALKKPDKALKLYGDLAERPESRFAADALSDQGLLLFELQRFPDAAKAFDTFGTRFAKHPRVPNAHLNAGFAYYRDGKFTTAIDRFQKAAADKSLQPQAVYWNASSRKALKNYPEAVALLKTEFTRDDNSAMAAKILYEWATCERLQSHYAAAGTLYLDFVKRWPKTDDADDALHFAGDMALLNRKPEDAAQLVDRFRREYPNSSLWPSRDLLQARINAVGTDKAKFREAVKLLDNVIAKSANAGTKSAARYQLAITYRLLNDHKQALKTVEPLVKQVARDGADSPFVDAVILAGRSQLADKQYDQSVATMSLYLKLKPSGDQAVEALRTRAAAAWETGNTKIVSDDVDRLLKTHADNPVAGQTVHQLAEKSYQKKDWKSSGDLFSKLLLLGKTSQFHPLALSGLGWSQFEQKLYAEAAKTFSQLVKDHPDDALLASQAAYKQAECTEKLEKFAFAAAEYLAAFKQFAPKTPAKPGSEKSGQPHYYTYHAGLNAARTLAKLKKTKEADAAYESLFAKFPKPERLDARLDEWALLHYNNGNYKRADDIFRRLIRDNPTSPLVDNARYTLAESDLNAGKQDAARKVFRELYDSLKSDALVREVALYRLIGIAIEREEWKTAQQHAVAFRKDFPNSGHQWYAAFCEAEARFHQNDLKESRKILLMLQSEKPESPAAKADWFPRVWVLLAETAARQTEYVAVESLVADGKKRFDKWPRVYLLDEILGRSLKRQAKFNEARKAFGRVVNHAAARRTETAAKCQFLIADTHLMQDDYASAQREYFRVDSLYDFPIWQAPALFMAGQCEEKLKDYKSAVKTYQDLIKRFPKSAFAAKAQPRLAAARKLAKTL